MFLRSRGGWAMLCCRLRANASSDGCGLTCNIALLFCELCRHHRLKASRKSDHNLPCRLGDFRLRRLTAGESAQG
jgi:hypothetical protein